MRRVTLIFNPNAGHAAVFRKREAELFKLLHAHGFTPRLETTTADPHSARDLGMRAQHHADLVLACGGDGTVHGVVQGLAGTSTPLGVLPFGTANALARNLGLSPDPVRALEQLLTFTAVPVPLGCAKTPAAERWFLVMAGAGPDGTLIHRMRLATKPRLGRHAYTLEAARLFLTQRFPPFRVDYRLVGSPTWHTREAVALLASRVPDLGGLFRGLTRHARLDHPHLHVQILAAPAHLSLPAWFALGKSRLEKANPWLTTLEAEELHCHPHKSSLFPTHAQADAEPLGPLPLHLTLHKASLHLLMPLKDNGYSS